MNADGSPRTPLRAWLAWAAAATFYAYGFFQRVAPAVVSHELVVDLAGDATRLGVLSAAYFYAYAAVQVPAGMLLDRFGARRLLLAAAGIATLGGFLFALAPAFAAATAGRALVGLGVGCAYLGSLAIAARTLPPGRFGLVAGLTLAIGTAGALAAQAPLALLVAALGSWRAALVLVAAAGALVTLLLALAVPADRRSAPGGGAGAGLLDVLRRPPVWALLVVAGCTGAPILAFAGLWGVPWLRDAYGVDAARAGLFTSLVLLAWGVGGPLCGALSDRFGRRGVLAGGALVAAASFASMQAEPPLVLLPLPLALLGLSGGAMVAAYAFARDLVPPERAGAAMGLVNSGVLVFAALLQTLIGAVLDATRTGEVLSGDWRLAWLAPTACLLLAGITALLLPGTRRAVMMRTGSDA